MNRIDLPQASNEPETAADLTRSNQPALPVLTYRGGKYRPTLNRMLASLTEQESLARLNQDANDDWSIALLHAWSIVTDVLGFYQERITNEGYIRTAAERRSVLALARALGYDWRPGLAASVDLALTVSPDDQGKPQSVTVKKGSAIQSTPPEGQLPQIFETSSDTQVRTEWNQLYPYVGLKAGESAEGEALATDVTSLRVANYRSDLQKDQVILLVDQRKAEQQTEPTQPAWVLGTLSEVIADPQKPYTIIRWKINHAVGTTIQQPALYVFRQKAMLFGYAKGAVYFDSEEAPGETKGDTTAGKPEQPGTVKTNVALITATRSESEPTKKDDGTEEIPTPTPKTAQWTPRTLSLPNSDINAFVANPAGVLFAGTKRDLYRSTDQGESWQLIGIDPVGRNVTALTFYDGRLFAGSSTGGIYLSYDNGDNWTPVSGDSVAPEVKVTKENNGDTFKVDAPEILPKAPILSLEFGKNRAGDTLFYALAGKELYASDNEGKSWKKIKPEEELPATLKSVSGAEQRKTMLNAAAMLITSAKLQWLKSSIEALANGASSTQWLGLDLWTFLKSLLGKSSAEVNAVRSLAVSTQGKKSTVVVGTDAGKFTLKERTRRWLVATVIILLILLQQFLFHRNDIGSPALEIATVGVVEVAPVLASGKVVTATSELLSHGRLKIKDEKGVVVTNTYTLKLQGIGTLPASVDEKKGILSAAGELSFSGSLVSGTVLSTVAITSLTTLTATIAPGVEITDTFFAISTTEAINLNLTLTATASVSKEAAFLPPVISLSNMEITGTIVAAPALPEDERFPWLTMIWQQASELLQSTFIASWGAIKSFVLDLWAALPEWIKITLATVYENVIQPAIQFVDSYLINPLLNYTASTLVEMSAIVLAVLALLLAWIYADQKMSNRKTVRLEGAVNALAIAENGQIFAGTEKGVYRSVADDPNASWWTKTTRLLIRSLFPDVSMEPINYGLTYIDPDTKKEVFPDIRSLSFTNTKALLVGTADGRIYRLAQPTAELDPAVIAEQKKQTEATTKTSTKTPTPDPKPSPVIQWEAYDQGIVDVEPFKSSLKTVQTLAITPKGQFVSGKMGADKVEDLWFTSQFHLETIDEQKVRVCEIDLNGLFPDLKSDSWLLLCQKQPDKSDPKKSEVVYARYQVKDVQRVRSRDFVTIGEFTRAIVYENEVLGATEKAISSFSRTQSEVLLQSEAVALFDNRPVQGKILDLKGYVPDLKPGQRLIVTGRQKLVLVTETRQDALRAANNLEWRTLEKGELLHVVASPQEVEIAEILETMPDAFSVDNSQKRRTLNKGDLLQIVTKPDLVAIKEKAEVSTTETTDLQPVPVVHWHLRTLAGIVGTVDATTQQIQLVRGLRWQLRTRTGFIGTVDATKEQIRWMLPGESEPEVSEVVEIVGSEPSNLADEAKIQAEVQNVYQNVPVTRVNLKEGLAHVYDRATVSVFGNIVAATHGQTVKDEVLGSGSGMQANERFMLQERPLTYLSADNDQGYQSEITVRVNNIEWQQERYLYGLTRDQRAYIVRPDALDNTYVTFGDGKQGARLPTGTEQITATYRIGIGKKGNVPAYTIDQPQSLPSAVRRVTNPLPASNGVGPDKMDNVRQQAPLSVRNMERIVSLSDYEDYVRRYAGIGRVRLKMFGEGSSMLLHFTVADSNGGMIAPDAPLLDNLRKSIDERRTLATPQLQIQSFEQLYFDIAGELLIAPDHKGRVRVIEEEIRQKLAKAFSFKKREFGQSVAESEVIALLQTLNGIAFVKNVQLTSSSDGEKLKPLDDDEDPTPHPAKLLLLNPSPRGVQLEIASTDEPSKVLNSGCFENTNFSSSKIVVFKQSEL